VDAAHVRVECVISLRLQRALFSGVASSEPNGHRLATHGCGERKNARRRRTECSRVKVRGPLLSAWSQRDTSRARCPAHVETGLAAGSLRRCLAKEDSMLPMNVASAYETAQGIVNERIEQVRRLQQTHLCMQASRARRQFRRSVLKGLSRGLRVAEMASELCTAQRTTVQT